MKFLNLMLACSLALGATFDAEAAKRLGGGGSVGKQSSNVTQREAANSPAAPGATQAPANQPAATTAARPATAATPAAAQPPQRRPWGAMLGGLAAGLGLAWLAHSLGLGAEFGQFLMFALLALVVMVVVGMVMRARRAGGGNSNGAYALQGAGAPADQARSPRQYNPDKIGNDASARPWEQAAGFTETPPAAAPQASGLRIGSALAGSPDWSVPADFDAAGFLATAKRNFIVLQDAWDRSDLATLRAMMTDEMVSEIRVQLAEREAHAGGQPSKTEVAMLEAQLLGIEDLGRGYMASVEFSGMIREDASAGPAPFREVWNMTKPKDGSSGWLVAGVQALQ